MSSRNETTGWRHGWMIITLSVGIALSTAAQADVSWSVEAGVASTDNAALTNTGELDDTLASAGGTLTIDHQTERLQLQLQGNGTFQSYLQDTFGDDFIGQAVGSLTLEVLPERLSWVLENTYGQIATNQFEPITPENRQNVNTLTTGPDLRLRLGGRTSLILSGRYGDTRYESSDQINTRNWGGAATFERRASSATALALVASQYRYDYDTPFARAYDQQSLYGRWQTSSSRQSVAVSVGANQVGASGDRHARPMLSVAWQRQLTPSWTLDVNATSEYQNTGEQFAAQAADGSAVPASQVGIAATPAAANRADVRLAFERTRTRFSLGGGYSKLNFVGIDSIDESGWNAMADVSRRIRPRLEGHVRVQVLRRDYDSGLNPGNRERVAEVGADWRLGRSTFLALGYQYRDADSPNTNFRYSQNLVSAALSYRRGD